MFYRNCRENNRATFCRKLKRMKCTDQIYSLQPPLKHRFPHAFPVLFIMTGITTQSFKFTYKLFSFDQLGLLDPLTVNLFNHKNL